jgi:cytochrome c peroxidase
MTKARIRVSLSSILAIGIVAGICPLPGEQQDRQNGKHLFERETFGGNGRTCLTCHARDTGTISQEEVRRRLKENRYDPLFLHDGSDDGRGNGVSRIVKNATFLVEIPLPAGVMLADDAKATSVVLPRGVPSTINTPALDPVLMVDGRHPNLESQAAGAINDHFQPTAHVKNKDLRRIAEFQQTEDFFSSATLRRFARGGPEPQLPEGRTESEKRGRLFFVDAPFNGGKRGICAACHGGPMLNQTTENLPLPVPPGTRFVSAGVSEFNAAGNQVREFIVRRGDGTSITVKSPDPGRALITGDFRPNAFDSLNAFKIPTLWGVRRTAPYFHDNSARTLEDAAAHYAKFFEAITQPNPLILTLQDQKDMVAYLKLLE